MNTSALPSSWQGCSLWIKTEQLRFIKEFKYLRILFFCEGKIEHEIDCSGEASAVMWSLHQNHCGEEEAEPGARLSLTGWSTLSAQRRWMRLWIKAAEMSFLCRQAGLNPRERLKSSDIWMKLRVELLRSLSLKRFNLFGAQIRSGCLLGALLWIASGLKFLLGISRLKLSPCMLREATHIYCDGWTCSAFLLQFFIECFWPYIISKFTHLAWFHLP